MIPVVRVLVERAAARRESLLGLAGAIPAGYWDRAAAGDPWTAYTHFAHALSADTVLAAFIGGLKPGTRPVELDVPTLVVARERAIAAAASLEPSALFAYGHESRASAVVVLATLKPTDLDRPMVMTGRADAWGGDAMLSLYAYLEQWAAHDWLHESAIRAAISTPPDLSAALHIRTVR